MGIINLCLSVAILVIVILILNKLSKMAHLNVPNVSTMMGDAQSEKARCMMQDAKCLKLSRGAGKCVSNREVKCVESGYEENPCVAQGCGHVPRPGFL